LDRALVLPPFLMVINTRHRLYNLRQSALMDSVQLIF
jgi:hypothetical protein